MKFQIFSERPVHNFKRYLSHVKSGRTLPELRMIDIGNNYVDLEDIILLIETHPKLEQISLIGKCFIFYCKKKNTRQGFSKVKLRALKLKCGRELWAELKLQGYHSS